MVEQPFEDTEEREFSSMVFYCVKYIKHGKLGAMSFLKFYTKIEVLLIDFL